VGACLGDIRGPRHHSAPRAFWLPRRRRGRPSAREDNRQNLRRGTQRFCPSRGLGRRDYITISGSSEDGGTDLAAVEAMMQMDGVLLARRQIVPQARSFGVCRTPAADVASVVPVPEPEAGHQRKNDGAADRVKAKDPYCG
jgi:hypothetical protein